MSLGVSKIGILQGRVIPERIDKLQLFPILNWKKEFIEIQDIGFDCVELLFDKKLVFEKALFDFDGLNSFNDALIKAKNLRLGSICADYFSTISLISAKTQKLFYEYVLKFINLARSISIEVVVIPFFDKNIITATRDLEYVLSWIKKQGIDEIAVEHNVVLSIELNLSARQIKNAFSGYQFRNVKICYDLGNAKALGYNPEEEILVLRELINHVHIKDCKVNGPNVMLGKGDVDFNACFKVLKQIDYAGLMILETGYFNDPSSEALENLVFVKKILESI